MLVSHVDSRCRALDSFSLLSVPGRHLLAGLLAGLAATALIRYQAVEIWSKKARSHRKLEPPRQPLFR
jgi:hypothetical protein